MHLREAADVLGVHYQTVYGWVRRGVLPARKHPSGYEVVDEDVARLAVSRARGREPPREVRVRDWTALAARVYAAVRNGDESQARADLNRLAGTIRVVDLCEKVIAPVLQQIGSDWVAGTVSIAQEHRATAICERLIGEHARQPAGRPRGVAVTATPAGEPHEMPALMAAACLREDHWQVHYLAADLPWAEILRLATDADADLIVLSTTTATGSHGAAAAQAALDTAALDTAAPGTAGADAARPIGPDQASSRRPRLLVGRPGDSVHDLILLAREIRSAQMSPRSTTPE
jgi:excisionase family DNA binding protein